MYYLYDCIVQFHVCLCCKVIFPYTYKCVLLSYWLKRLVHGCIYTNKAWHEYHCVLPDCSKLSEGMFQTHITFMATIAVYWILCKLFLDTFVCRLLLWVSQIYDGCNSIGTSMFVLLYTTHTARNEIILIESMSVFHPWQDLVFTICTIKHLFGIMEFIAMNPWISCMLTYHEYMQCYLLALMYER